MTTSPRPQTKIFAHRGFSSRQPEMTVAAYRDAIDWAAAEQVELGLECDVHFSEDDQLICLHDLLIDRTSNATGAAYEHSVDELKSIDFGSWKTPDPSADQRELVTLAELLALVSEARECGVQVTLAIETKHPNPRGLEIEERVREMLEPYGWTAPGSPVRMITFSVPAVERLGEVLPDLERTLLIQIDLAEWSSGVLPEGVRIAGPDVTLLRRDPGFVARAREHGNEVHAWTVNEFDDIQFCLDLGVTGYTTDYPDRVLEVLGRD